MGVPRRYLCQLHEVYVDEKRWSTDDGAGPSKTPESRNSGGKGKEKTITAFKLASDIKQQTDLKKVLEESILDSRVEFSLRELLGIAKDFHNLLVDLVKKKRQNYGGKCSKVKCKLGSDEWHRSGGNSVLPLHKATLGTCNFGDSGPNRPHQRARASID